MESGLKRILNLIIASIFTTIGSLLIVWLFQFTLFGVFEIKETNIYVYIIIFIWMFIYYMIMSTKSEITISKEESEDIIERLKKRRFKNFYDGDITVFYRSKLESSIGMEIKVLHNENGMTKLIVPFDYKHFILASGKNLLITLIIRIVLSITLILSVGLMGLLL